MLVLSRRKNEAINIGDDIRISVVRIQGNVVRIGIEAPKALKVVRAELGPETEDTGIPLCDQQTD